MARPKSPAQMIDAIFAAKGKLALVARTLGCDPKTVYNYIDKYPEVKEAVEQARHDFDLQLLDVAETGLMEALLKKQQWAIRYALDKKGHSRGYVDRQELTGENGGAIIIKTGMSLDDI